jgi:uncharacterized protein YecT (DUF1311 family)
MVRSCLATVSLVATLPLAAQTALVECSRQVTMRAEMAACLLRAQRTASDEMMAAYRQVLSEAERLELATGRGGVAAQLTVSQRDFERYVDGQCRFVHRLFDSGNGADQAALACEVDLLRQRADALSASLPAPPAR